MFQRPPMKVSDFTCILCGSNLGLKINTVKIGDNEGTCPMCNELYLINITKKEMEEFFESEETVSL